MAMSQAAKRDVALSKDALLKSYRKRLKVFIFKNIISLTSHKKKLRLDGNVFLTHSFMNRLNFDKNLCEC